VPTTKSQTLSILLHLAVLAVLLLANSAVLVRPPDPLPAKVFRLFAPPREQARKPAAQAGGANQDILPARPGAPPPRVQRIFVPPAAKPNPKLPIPVGVEFDAPNPTLVAADMGDPLGKLGSNSLGTGGIYGNGNGGCCRGIGDHDGAPGIDGGGTGHPIVPPKLLYKIEPEFSEEARKAKYQGTVVLSIEVDTSGNPSRFAIVSGLGLGLNEKAIEAVSKWRFRPAFRDGKPIATNARIEVNFRLL
jgi:TonB family protein